jgi:molecular chaperone GrpE
MSDPTPAPDQPAPDDPALRLAELAGEVARLKDTLLRSHADQQNQQRRHQRERDDLRKFAVAGLVEDLLPALDSLTLGLESATKQPEAKAVADGFRIIDIDRVGTNLYDAVFVKNEGVYFNS